MMIPPMGQAALGIEILDGNKELLEIAISLNDPSTFVCTRVERDFISKIGAGCSAPVACNAVIDNETIVFRTMIGFPNGTNIMQETMTKSMYEGRNLGSEVAEKMIANGALELLKKAEESAFKDEMPQRL